LTNTSFRLKNGSTSILVLLAQPFSSVRRALAHLISAPVTLLYSLITLVSKKVPILQDNTYCAGHYIENTSKTENLVWIEIYKSDRVADISLTQWLALTPPDIVANTLKIPISVVQQLKKQKQLLVKGT
jgi:hypothetical protein